MTQQPQRTPRRSTTLRYNSLPFYEVLAQSVANTSPSATPILTIAFVFAMGGNGTWLDFVLATIAMLLVSFNINQFARRSASSGVLYTYVAKGLGTTAGVLTGWSLTLAYLLVSMAVVSAFAIFGTGLFNALGVPIPAIVFLALASGLSGYLAYTDVRLSASVMFRVEITSVMVILLLSLIVLFQKGFIDPAQLQLQKVSLDGFIPALVLATLAFTGFESATALGEEAQQPLRTIPRAVVWTTTLSGLFFIFSSYAIVLAFQDAASPLSQSVSPLSFLAEKTGLGFFRVLIPLAAMMTYFGTSLAGLNAGSRLLFLMSRHGIFPIALSRIHQQNRTPHVAILLLAALSFLIPTALIICGLPLADTALALASIGTYGFIVAYLLVCIATPFYLHRLKKLKPIHIGVAILSALLMLLPIVGSFYPVPPPPTNLFPYIFLVLLIPGIGCFFWRWRQSSWLLEDIQRDIATVDYKFGQIEELSDSAIVAAIETDIYNFYLGFGFFPNADLYESPNLSWYRTGIPFHMCNGVIRARLHQADINRRIEAILYPFKSQSMPMMWIVSPSSQPTNLGQHLEAQGLSHREDWAGMALNLDKFQEPSLPDSLQVIEVEDLETFKQWLYPLVKAFQVPDSAIESLAAGFTNMELDADFCRHYVGLLDGQPVGSSMVMFEEGFAGISILAVIPEARERGIGTAMTCAALSGAKQREYRIAVLQATPAAFGLCQKLGFREYCKFEIYGWHPVLPT
jgi:amino acid transporter/ribosomal protein S18 acetylase RimI-like enzyme